MRLLLAGSLAFLIAACGTATVTPSPSVPAPSTSPLATPTIDCGPFSGDLPDCVAIVFAAVKSLHVSLPAGTRAEVSRSVAVADGHEPKPNFELAAAARVAHVTFVSPARTFWSADVMTDPLGEYVGVNPTFGP